MTNKPNPTQSFMSTARGNEYKFLPAVLYGLEEFDKKNNAPLYSLIAFVNGKYCKGVKVIDNAGGESGLKAQEFVSPLKRVLGRALSDVKFIFKDGRCTVKVGKNGGVNHDVVDELRQTLEFFKNVSVRSDAFKELFPVVKPDAQVLTDEEINAKIEKSLEALAKRLGITETNLKARISGVSAPATDRNSDENILN